MTRSGIFALLLAVLASTASGDVTISGTAPASDILSSLPNGTIWTRLFDEDASSNHARGQLFSLPDGAGIAFQITAVTVSKNGGQTFADDTLTLRFFEGTEARWVTGTGHSTALDGDDYFVDTTVVPLHTETFTLSGTISDGEYVTFELVEPLIVNEDSEFGFLMTYHEFAASSPDYFQHNEGSSGGRISITTTEHGTASRNILYFVQGNVLDSGTDDDGDGLADAWELLHFKGLGQTGTGNPDGDGADNEAEETAGTDPNDRDSDDDGLEDDVEIAGPTDPLDPDSDDDQLLDGVETGTGTYVASSDTGTHPMLEDTDGDGVLDGAEISLGTDPSDGTHQPGELPNIVFIMIDDLDIREIGVYGQATLQTPRVDTMASQGMMFTDFYTASPVCQPSRSCLMTGQDARRAQDRHNSSVALKSSRVTIAEVLKQAGYTTGCVGKWGLGGSTSVGAPWNQGFDFFCGYLSQTAAHRFFPKYLWRNDQRIYFDQTLADSEGGTLYIPGAANLNGTTHDWDDDFGNVCSHDVAVAEGLQFIEDNADQPFFLYCAWTPPHAYMYPAATLDALTDADGLLYDPLDLDQTVINEVYPGAPFGGTPERPDFNNHCYASMVSAADRDTGRIVDKLVELGIDDKTLVIFTSDNGEDEPTFLTAEHLKPGYSDLRGLKRDCYEGGIREPFVAWWPGTIQTGTTSSVVGTFADMLPTFAEMAGLSTPPQVTGRSILPALLGGAEEDLQPRDYHYWYFTEGTRRWRAVRQGDRKIVRNRATDGSAPTYELFNLASDLYETADLASTEPDVLARLIPLVEGTHEVTVSTYFKADDEFFTRSDLTAAAYLIGSPDGSGAANGYSLSPNGTGSCFSYLPFETGLNVAATFSWTMQFPSGGAASFLLGGSNDATQCLAVRIDPTTLGLEVRHGGTSAAGATLAAEDVPGGRAECLLGVDPVSGSGEVVIGSSTLAFDLAAPIGPLRFWGYQVETATVQTSRPRWRLETSEAGGGEFDHKDGSGAIEVSYRFPFILGQSVNSQYSLDLEAWFDTPPGLLDIRSTSSQGVLEGAWHLPKDSLLPRQHDRLFLRSRMGP